MRSGHDRPRDQNQAGCWAMSADPLPAPGASYQPGGISEVSRLANLLAERVLSAHMADAPVPDAHVRALVAAGLLLDEYGQDVPPLLIPIMDELRTGMAAEAEPQEHGSMEQEQAPARNQGPQGDRNG